MYIFCYKTCIISRILMCKPLDASYKYTGAFNLMRQHVDSSGTFNKCIHSCVILGTFPRSPHACLH